MNYQVYILFSESLDRFYVGYTSDFSVRKQFHLNPEEKRKFTAKADDWVLFFKIMCACKKQAIEIERHIKAMKSKKYIANLKQFPEMTDRLLLKYPCE